MLFRNIHQTSFYVHGRKHILANSGKPIEEKTEHDKSNKIGSDDECVANRAKCDESNYIAK
jgi:hypothetical protein